MSDVSDVHVVVLAAGKGTRMKSALPKVLHRVAGLPMIDHVLSTAAQLGPLTTTVVVGHEAEGLKSALARHSSLTFVVQEPQLGTAHALLTTESVLRKEAGTLVLLSGDVPLLSGRHPQNAGGSPPGDRRGRHGRDGDSWNPAGYGRIVRSGEQIARIVEEKDASPAERAIREINSGIYAFALDGLFDALRAIAAGKCADEVLPARSRRHLSPPGSNR